MIYPKKFKSIITNYTNSGSECGYQSRKGLFFLLYDRCEIFAGFHKWLISVRELDRPSLMGSPFLVTFFPSTIFKLEILLRDLSSLPLDPTYVDKRGKDCVHTKGLEFVFTFFYCFSSLLVVESTRITKELTRFKNKIGQLNHGRVFLFGRSTAWEHANWRQLARFVPCASRNSAGRCHCLNLYMSLLISSRLRTWLLIFYKYYKVCYFSFVNGNK